MTHAKHSELTLECDNPSAIKRLVDKFFCIANMRLPVTESAREVRINVTGHDDETVMKVHVAMLTVSFAKMINGITLRRQY